MKLHQRVVMTAAGNLDTDRAIVESLGTAMQSRLVHIEIEVDHREWIEDVALAQKYDERILAYLMYDEKQLMDFKPDHDEKTFCCPRTWEFMNRLVKGKPVTEKKTGLYGGTITSGTAAAFVAFCQLQKELVTINDVLADPKNASVPDESQRRWIVTAHLINKITDANFADICTYMGRMDLSFRILFFRAAMAQHPNLHGHPAYTKALSELSRYLNQK